MKLTISDAAKICGCDSNTLRIAAAELGYLRHGDHLGIPVGCSERLLERVTALQNGTRTIPTSIKLTRPCPMLP